MIGTRRDRAVKVRDFDLAVKAAGDDGRFSGHGSVFGVEDSYGEIVAPGAFTASLAEIAAKGRKVPVLWQHRTEEPIGVYDRLEEDATGLALDGRLLTKSVARAAEAHALMTAGAVTGLSIGYRVREHKRNDETGIITLTNLELLEVSLVTFPANDLARVDAVKLKVAHGGLPTLPEFETLLRDAGFSKRKAAVIANRGLKHLLDGRDARGAADDDTGSARALLAQLRGFSLPK
ncbi:HK97 family phage prohead protease [Methylobacterium terrae]|uniref:HK97 family phage prohead protease n=1 Tax=Methylobacterium terrae TaxID=2202827 RepID=A0A2U8WQA8_9HYPH|nr:HK97 family phage prohead protease [Methylobacterium terrae]AWN47640.1 HK97 family phage prohead protease [Methylobacterium terrae]